jgi:acetyl esterase/lipase
MTNRAVIALVALLWGFTAVAAGRPLPAFEVNDRPSPADPLPERETRWNHPGVTLTSLNYSALRGYRPLRLDLYRQPAVTTPQPLVMFIHGGAWSFANPRVGAAFRNFPFILAALAERGYVVASIEYRLSREALYPAQSEDVGAALSYLRSNAARLGIDPARIALWGMSAGAHLGAMNAVTCERAACVQGFVGWFGVYDLQAFVEDTAGDTMSLEFLGCGSQPCSPERLAAASPRLHVKSGAPPILLLDCELDDAKFAQRSREFAQRLREAGNPADAIAIPGVTHGFIGADDEATRRALQQALAATFDFFDRVLRPGGTQPSQIEAK